MFFGTFCCFLCLVVLLRKLLLRFFRGSEIAISKYFKESLVVEDQDCVHLVMVEVIESVWQKRLRVNTAA